VRSVAAASAPRNRSTRADERRVRLHDDLVEAGERRRDAGIVAVRH
jgi:hypothetical protein